MIDPGRISKVLVFPFEMIFIFAFRQLRNRLRRLRAVSDGRSLHFPVRKCLG